MTKNNLFNKPILNNYVQTNSLIVTRIYVVISLVILVYGYTEIRSKISFLIFFLMMGILLFTFIEYIFHRFLYHSTKNYLDERQWQYKIHGIHHKYPKDKDILAMPLPLALIMSAVFFLLFYVVLGNNVYFFFPGFLLGYSAYLWIHYKIHTKRPPKNLFKYLWKHHHKHHHRYDDKAFGVSSPLWDIIFRTMPPNKRTFDKNEQH